MRKATLACDHCGGPVTYRAPFCPFCRTQQSWDAHVVLQPGAGVARPDLAREPLPGREGDPSTQQRVQGGVMVEPAAAKIRRGSFPFDLRDGCITVRGTALDEGGCFGVIARMQTHGTATACYELEVYPAFRSFRLRRCLWMKGKLYATVLNEWEHVATLAGVGLPNLVELRFADSVFQIVLNGELAGTVLDACFGYGAPGWIVASESDVAAARVLIDYLAVSQVV